MMRITIIISVLLFCSCFKVSAQKKDDFVMYAKDSVIEIKKTEKQAVAMVDSIPFELTVAQKQVLINIISEEIQSIDFINKNQLLSVDDRKSAIINIKQIKLNQIKEHLSPQQYKLFLSWSKSNALILPL